MSKPLTLEQLYDIRLALHDSIYTDFNKVNNIIDRLSDLDLFNVEYYPNERIIVLKIKKTNIKKKYNNYSHDLFFYNDNIIQPVINRVFIQYADDITAAMQNKKSLVGLTSNVIIETNNANAVYRISTLLDNMVVINL